VYSTPISMVFHPTITPPYYACVFSNQHNDSSPDQVEGYTDLAEQIDQLARQQPGYLGIDSSRNSNGFGITVSYWETDQDMREWKQQVDHLAAQKIGRERFYADFHVHIARVERGYAMHRHPQMAATKQDTVGET